MKESSPRLQNVPGDILLNNEILSEIGKPIFKYIYIYIYFFFFIFNFFFFF